MEKGTSPSSAVWSLIFSRELTFTEIYVPPVFCRNSFDDTFPTKRINSQTYEVKLLETRDIPENLSLDPHRKCRYVEGFFEELHRNF